MNGSENLHLNLRSERVCFYLFPDVGARNYRRFCAVNYNKTPGFEVCSQKTNKQTNKQTNNSKCASDFTKWQFSFRILLKN